MPKLYPVGWGFKADNIEESVQEGLEEVKIQMDRNNPDKYITFENIRFERRRDIESPTSIKDAKVHNKSLLTRIYADIVKVDGNARKVVEKNVQIGQLPHLIDGHNAFIVNGSEYNLVNQTRRNSSSYVSTDNNGNAFAEFNLAKGRNFDITLDPHTNMFYVEIGTSKIILKPVLDALNITGEDFKKIVGDKLYQANWAQITDRVLETNYRKLYGKFYEYLDEEVSDLPYAKIKEGCEKYFEDKTRVDQKTTKYLYNTDSKRVDKPLMLATLRKFIAVTDGKEPGVDVDDLYYQRIFPPNLLYKDRVAKVVPELTNKLRFKIKNEDNYRSAFENVFSKPLISLVNTSNLSRLDPQYNPLGMYSAGTTVTPLGMGGIQDIQAVRRGTRGIHNSYLGVIDPIASPQGQNSGIQSKLVDEVHVDKEGSIHIPVKNKKGERVMMNITDLYEHHLMLPGQDKSKAIVDAMFNGKVVKVNRSKIDFELWKDTEGVLNDLNKLNPMAQAVQGNRNYMTYRFFTQSLPLKYRETPKVLPVDADGKSAYKTLREKLSKLMPFQSPVEGTVSKVTEEEIIITDSTGEKHSVKYHTHLPFATNTGLDQKPIVKSGDKVKKGQIILDDSYTDKEGNLAVGTNLRVGFTPYYGYNAEDAVVISEDARKKLTSEHYYTYQISRDDSQHIIDKKKFRSMFSDKYSMDQLDKLDDEGVVRKGSKVSYRDIIIATIDKRTPDDKLGRLGKLSKNIVTNLIDGAITYPIRVEGEVIEVTKTPKMISVTVKTEEPAEIGDKVSNLYGGKGVISHIVPNDQMLQDEKGRPVDMLFSSTVVVSRINPAQVYENALGKIVTDKGIDPYKFNFLKNPEGKSLNKFVQDEMKKHGIKDKEILFDPIANKHIKRPVAVGNMYILKLLKGDKDVAARSVGPSYTASEVPSKGGKEGAKAIGNAEFYALVGHNARSFLSEVSNIKSQKNPEFWRNFELGLSTPVKGNSFTWDKFKAMVTSAGGYVEQSNHAHQIVPLTDGITDRLAGHRVLETPAMLKAKSLEPIKKGLFDPNVVGGIDGKLWAKIKLEDGIVSPLVADYVKLALGMTEPEFKEWQASSDTKKMRKDLRAIDTKAVLKELKDRSKAKNLTNNEIKLYRFLSNLQDKNMELEDLVITSIPVPPPIYRPITKLENGETQLADLNLFYKDVMLANQALPAVMDSKFKTEAKQTLVDNIDALIGKKDPKNIQLQRKGSRGVLAYIGGIGSPKNGYIHSTMLKKNQDMVGRARIIPDAKMDPDTIGLPEKMAWKLYEVHIRQELIKSGKSSGEAQKMIDNHDPLARDIMIRLMNKIPVLYNRAPTLHRFGMIAAKPKLIAGESTAINMFATTPLNADFDGDTVMTHAPVTDKTSKELDKLLLSKMPFSDSDIDALLYKLTVEAILGFHQMSKEDPGKVQADVRKIIDGTITVTEPLTKKSINKMLVYAVKKYPARVNQIFLDMKNLGEEYATNIGSTVGVDDVAPLEKEKSALLRKYRPKIDAAKNQMEKIKHMESLQKDMIDLAAKHTGDLTEMVASGAKGKSNQLASIVTSPVIAYDPDHPIDSAELTPGNFAEGLDIRDFWLLNAKARKDLVATALNVSVPGSLSKLMLANVNREVITIDDCGTKKGIYVDYDSPDVLGRVLQEQEGSLKRGAIVTTDNRKSLPRKKIFVRSPLTCEADKGICQKCYGADSHWKLPEIGWNVGVNAAYSISEPLAQMALDSKHGGRSITRDVTGGGMSQIQSIFSSDTTNPRVSILANEDDVVEAIEESPGGIRIIMMEDGTSYRIPANSEIIVKKGDKVKRGDKLTEGVLPFTRVTELKGINAGRQVLADEVSRVISENGGRVHKRLTEILGKAAVNSIEILTPFKEFIPGDVVPYNKFKGICEELGYAVSVKNLVPKMILADEYDDLSAGHSLTQNDVVKLKAKYDRVKILPEDVRVRPSLKSLYTSGLEGDDWINSLGQKYIKKNIISATAEGDMSDDRSVSPMVPWLKGAPFRTEGPEY